MLFKVIFRQKCPWFTLIKDKASYLNAKSTHSLTSHRGCLQHDKYYKHEKWSLTFPAITIKLLFPLSYFSFLFFFFFTSAVTWPQEKITSPVPDKGRPFILLIPEVSDHEVWRLQWKSWDLMVSIIIKTVNGVLSSHATQSRRDKRKLSPQLLQTALISQICWSLFNTAARGLLQRENNMHQSCADLTHSIMEWVSKGSCICLRWQQSS